VILFHCWSPVVRFLNLALGDFRLVELSLFSGEIIKPLIPFLKDLDFFSVCEITPFQFISPIFQLGKQHSRNGLNPMAFYS
jgi:hypothetical protein